MCFYSLMLFYIHSIDLSLYPTLILHSAKYITVRSMQCMFQIIARIKLKTEEDVNETKPIRSFKS
jgi:hypothetical protein